MRAARTLPAALLVAVTTLAGCGSAEQAVPTSAATSSTSPSSSPSSSTPSSTASQEETAADGLRDGGRLSIDDAGSAGVPTRLVVPSVGIDSALDDLRVRDGVLQAPRRWQVAGWYAGGTRPGDTGPAVLAGHLDSPGGPAVFARLAEVAVGAEVEVVDEAGTTRTFTVTRTVQASRADFPTQDVYGPTPDAQLRLITCSGTYDHGVGEYEDNLVVFATQTDQEEGAR